MEPHNDHSINLVGRVFLAAWFVAALVFLALVVGIAILLVVLDQGRANQRHIDCIVAAFAPEPPEYCIPVIEHLMAEGIIERPALTSVP